MGAAMGQRKWLAALGAAFLLASCGAGSLDPWVYQTSTDPLTDAAVHTATIAVQEESGAFKLEVTMRCSLLSDGATFDTALTFFRADDEPAPLRVTGFGMASVATIQMRLDDAAPQQLIASSLEFNNQVKLLMDTTGVETFPTVQRIVISPALENGNPVFIFDISSANPRRVLEACASLFPNTAPPETTQAAPATGAAIPAASLRTWIAAFRGGGSAEQITSGLQSTGMVSGEAWQQDYTSIYVARQPRVLFGHQVLALQTEEDGANDIGCCRRPRVSLFLRPGGDAQALEAFASENSCRVKPADFEHDYLRAAYEQAGAEMDNAAGEATLLECELRPE